MVDEDYLNVWHEKELVGKLWQNSFGMIGFRYEARWVGNGFPISQQLPLNNALYSPESGKAHHFFVNLLPESDARMHIVRDLKISNSDFELLRAIGGECAGALSILPIELLPTDISNHQKLTDEELNKILLRKGQFINLGPNENRPRLSLAGAQDKCPIYFDGENYFLPQGAASSTHILKFEIEGYRNVPVYEYFLTQLARAIGLPVVDIELKNYDDHYFLLIKRYDRIIGSSNDIKRLHQEDFCQALGISYQKKYEQEGGPSFFDCYKLVQEVTANPIKEVEKLLQWQIFNILAGNSDAHAKNLALIYRHGTQLAPFYDLVCTRAIDRIETNVALSVGGEFNPDKIIAKHWKKLADTCDIRYPYLKKMIGNVATALLDNLTKTFDAFESDHRPYPALQRVEKVIKTQCKIILRGLN